MTDVSLNDYNHVLRELDRRIARIAELEAELADALPAVRAERRKTARAEARIASVLALCDAKDGAGHWQHGSPSLRTYVLTSDVRAAAIGEGQ